MQAVPNPKSHVLCYEESLVGNLFLVNVVGDVDKTCQLLVDGVVWSPNPLLIVVCAIHLDEYCVVCWYGVEIAVAILRPVFLVLVESLPSTLHFAKFSLRSEVACFPVAAELLVPYESLLLASAQFVDHALDVCLQGSLVGRVCGTCKSECESRHVVARTVALKLCCWRVPTVSHLVTFGAHAVSVAVVVELLAHVPTKNSLDVEIAV